LVPVSDLFDEWRRLREERGDSVTVIDLYEMAARPRGLTAEQLPLEEREALGARALHVIHPGFALAPDSGRGLEPIELIPYDPAWPSRFTAWQERLLEAMHPKPARVAHIGSTAVPGLAAKPVIDIQVSVVDLENEASYARAIESTGVQLRSRDDDHRYFRPFAGRRRDVHIHVCTAGSEWERGHLLFVAYLTADAGARERYAEAKDQAAKRWADDRVAYTEAKSESIREILATAKVWATTTGWTC
jgi:GrpB-like predicted nucleotidyltransferase (UPF0157 family)